MVPFRRGMTPSFRQSWHITSIPEAESINIQPTVILENNMPTAKSRLSVIIGKYNNFSKILENEEELSNLPTSLNEVQEMKNSMNHSPSTPSTLSFSKDHKEIDLTPRPASMPIILNNDETFNSEESNVTLHDDLRKIEAKEMELEFSKNRSTFYSVSNSNQSIRSTVRNKDKFNARLSKASMRLSLNTRMQRRLNIALEIINTERNYVDCLLLIQNLFLDPLRKSLRTENQILTKKSIKDLFANILDIINVNSELLKRLEERVAGPFDEEVEETEFEFWNPENEAYLLMPVQRIPRYKMLLENLLKITTESHPDYLNLIKAYQIIESVATFVNETIRQHEMFVTMLEIQKSLAGFDEALLVPGRRFIKRGTVKKICRKNHQEREFFLFSDLLIYASRLNLIDNMYTFHRKIDLEDLMVLHAEKQDEKNAFQIISPQKSFTVYADTPQNKESWINVIRETKDEYLSAKRTLRIDGTVQLKRKDSHQKRIVESYLAPIWIPDSKADKCMNCSEEFTIFKRKHHCRACGKVVCHDCSTRNFTIPGTSEREDQLARACDACFFTMFPDAHRDEDKTSRTRVLNQTTSSNTLSNTLSNTSSNNLSNTTFNNTISSIKSIDNSERESHDPDPKIKDKIRSIHDAIVAKNCELCLVDFNVFRWRNECGKCKKILCTDCLTKKPNNDLTPTNSNRRFSMIYSFRLCDFCHLGLDPNRVNRVKHDERDGGGLTINYQISPPLSPKSP
ncbi:3451_t:CDS:10 [Diversispora eburnea]|uniref:3451_t:CDS:1 n=1 Tax=Diversispora eburnea TaxID=1213867 RepID=A0A9N8ZEL5_9GLOM|nr:3451_t:CDS:10 [Diversispora eburnea]